MVGAPLEDASRMIHLIRSRQREDGGFVEIDPMRHSGTNPTAAAVGLLQMLGGLDGPTRAAARRFLAAMQTQEGGLRANTRIPLADLLSTFTGLVALDQLGAASAIDTAAALRFVKSLEQPHGGFRAGAWDDAVDVEYTFYGLGALAVLQTMADLDS
jgi:geranylgeranyl transferase type-2 subunit beta